MAYARPPGGAQPAVETADLDRSHRSDPGRGIARSRRSGARALVAIALAFFVLGLLTREHYGSTWDEAESYDAGRANLGIVAALIGGHSGAIQWPWHELTGHQLVLDTLRSAIAHTLDPLLPESPAPIGERLFNLALTAVALWLTGLIALEVTGSAPLAAIAAGALALQPKLIAHAQNNPKDLPGLFVFVVAVFAFVRLERAPSRVRAAAAALAVGLAITTWLPAIALAPVAAFVLLVASAGGAEGAGETAGARAAWTSRGTRLLIVLGGGMVAAFALWPWLWPAPIERLGQIASRLAEFPTGFDVLYLGRLYPSSALPWHYTLGSLLIATPMVVTVLAIAGATEIAIDRDPRRRRLAALASVWIVSLLVLDGIASFHYDGVRHVLAVLPAIAMLAALGADRLRSWVADSLRPRASPRFAAAASSLVLLLPATAIAVDLARLHPYEDAYLASLVRRLEPGAMERRFEIEYWGSSYREVARWLDRNAERGASILAPIAPHCLAPYVRPDLEVHERMRPRLAAERHPYLVFITREAWYAPLGLDGVVATGPPLYSVRTAVGTLALVYRPEQVPRQLTRPGGPRSTKPSRVEPPARAESVAGSRRRPRDQRR